MASDDEEVSEDEDAKKKGTKTQSLTWRVPAGTQTHFEFVAAATLAVRYAAAIFVAAAVWRAPAASRFTQAGGAKAKGGKRE